MSCSGHASRATELQRSYGADRKNGEKTARFNLSDFSFSFASNRDQLLEIRRRYGLDEKGGTKGKSK